MFTVIGLISHTISDFILQRDEDVDDKRKLKLKAFFHHGLILFITLFIFIPLVNKTDYIIWVVVSLVYSLIHIIIDYIKEIFDKINIRKINLGGKSKTKFLIFLADQFLHLLTIILIMRIARIEMNLEIINTIEGLLFSNGVITLNEFKAFAIIIYISFSGMYFVPLAYDVVYGNVEDYSKKISSILKKQVIDEEENELMDATKTGKYIGLLERTIILFLLFTNQIPSIAFVVALKSLARLKMTENKVFGEYYLLGTLTSVTYTIVMFNILKSII